MKYIYLLAGGDDERELALAEALALTGGRSCGAKIVEADRLVDIARTGYIAAGIELIAAGRDVAEARSELAARGIVSEGFGIEIKRIPRGLGVGRRETANAFAMEIEGRPDLDNPKERFLGFVTAEGVWFGRAIEAAEHDWRRFVRKPHDFSSALPAQNARGICNLLIRGGESVVDPCCGTGTLLIHAAALGARVTGFDINRKMVGATNKNLAHFGVEGSASLADAAEVSGDYDVLLTNIPYGKMSAISNEKAGQIVSNVLRLAPCGSIVAAEDISGLIRRLGNRVDVLRLHKFSVTRYVLVYERA